MGNIENNFSNKFQQLDLYHLEQTNPTTGVARLTKKKDQSKYLMKTIVTDSQQKCQQIKKANIHKANKVQAPITQLHQAFFEANQQFCGASYKISLIFSVFQKTLKTDIEQRRKQQRMYEEKQIIQLIRNLIQGSSFYKQIQQPHQKISSSNIYLNHERFILGDPLLSEEESYLSPEMMQVNQNRKIQVDGFTSDLYVIGLIGLEAYHLKSMTFLYHYKEIDEEKLKQMIRSIKYRQAKKIIKQLLGPPRLRVQAMVEILQQQFPTKKQRHEGSQQQLLKQKNKKDTKKQMYKQIMETKQQIKKMIKTNSIKQTVQPRYKLQTRLKANSIEKQNINASIILTQQNKQVQKQKQSQFNHNYVSHTHIYPPQQITYKTEVNVVLSQNSQSPRLQFQLSNSGSQPLHQLRRLNRHARSNSNIIFLSTTNQFKPSTGSTCHHRRNSSNSNMQQSQSNISFKQQEEHHYNRVHDLTPTKISLLKQKNGVLNTSVSSHGFENIGNSSHSLSKLSRLQDQQSSRVLHGQGLAYVQQFSSVFVSSQIDGLNLNSSVLTSHSRVSDKSNHSNVSNRPIPLNHQSRHSRSNSSITSHSNSQINIQSDQREAISNPSVHKWVMIKQQSMNQSLNYSKSISRQRIQQSQGSFDLQFFNKLTHKFSKNSSVQDSSQSQLLASQCSNQNYVHNKNSNNINSTTLMKSIKQPLQYHYQGQTKNNVRQGQGKLYSPSGKLVYQGQWKDGYYHGYGKLVNENIEFQQIDYKNLDLSRNSWVNYEGEFVRHLKHGFGKIVFSNGEVYEGQFVKDTVTGYGQFSDENNQVVDGIWSRGKLEKSI